MFYKIEYLSNMKLIFFGPGGRAFWYYMSLKTKFLTYRFIWKHKNMRSGGAKKCDHKFYVIGVDFHDEGLMSIVNSVMLHIEYALEKGYTPVVNMKDFQSIYQKENINAWEIFFEQPCGYSLSDVYGTNDIVLSMNVQYPKGYGSKMNPERIEKVRNLYKKLLRPNATLQSYLDNTLNTSNVCKEQIVACICRGTDYTNTLVGLPKQPTAEMVIQKVKSFMSEYKISKVYCATEDKRIYEKFQKEFKEKLLPNTQQKYGDNNGKLLSQVNVESGIDVFDIAFQYYRSLYFVTRCDYLIAGWVSGTRSVLLMPNNFKDVFIFSLGSVTKEDLYMVKN